MHPNMKKDYNKVHGISNISLTPRLEGKWYDLAVPLSFTALGHLDVGLFARGGPFYVGSPDFVRNALGNNLKSLKFFAGVHVPIGFPSIPDPGDLDKDGILDFADQCIDVPGPAENNGCPYGDRDQDGIMDNADACIDVPGPKENNGCPYADKDSDGVLDAADECIDVAGPIENNGCPYADKDEDGIFDVIDDCIDVPGPKENNGCPWGDKDKDGVLDKDDECIDLPGPAENKGCPKTDTDKDGLEDLEDECPLTPGPISNKGCPEIDSSELEIIRLAFENLEFEVDKAIIRPSSYANLNNLASLLVSKPSYKLLLAGHTDSDGSEEHNLILSKNRSESTKQYLVDKGVAAERIRTEYYGESSPIATNDTPEGKQRNRRVEMTIEFE
jgi:outer membrane protein OmpA-like peptidoglycan-associated protein